MSANPQTLTASTAAALALADLIRDLRTVADELEAAANGKPAAQLDSTVGECLTWDDRAFSFRIPPAIRCGACGLIQYAATLDDNRECPTCARISAAEAEHFAEAPALL